MATDSNKQASDVRKRTDADASKGRSKPSLRVAKKEPRFSRKQKIGIIAGCCAMVIATAAFTITPLLIEFLTREPDASSFVEPERFNDGTAMIEGSPTLKDYAAEAQIWNKVDPLAMDLPEHQDGIAGFTLAKNGKVPVLSEEHRAAIEEALEQYGSKVKTSFVLLDLETGRGFAQNLDTSIHAASSFKGPFSTFFCSEYLDSGEYEFDTRVACDPTSCPSGTSAGGKDSIYDLMSAAIINSSNEAYAALRAAGSNKVLSQWLESLNIDPEKPYGIRLPDFTVRDMSKMWLTTYNYLHSSAKSAETLADLLSRTDVSFIRSALEEAGIDAAVMNKAGWFNDDEHNICDAVVDCGIVACEGHEYLLCVMTSAKWTSYSVQQAQNLISAVFAARSDLAL